MAIESSTYFNGLVASEPTIDDDIVEGAGHISLLKSTLKNTFPNQGIAHRQTIVKGGDFNASLSENTAHYMCLNGAGMFLPAVGSFPETQYYTVQAKGAYGRVVGVLHGVQSTLTLWPGAVYECYVYAGSWRVECLTECVGDIKASMVAGNHANWVEANGAAISRAQYADLFAVLGVSHGAGDGGTTFNIPDLRGRMLLGYGGGFGLNARGGSPHAIIPAHTHSVSQTSHNHTVNGSRAILVKDGVDKAISEPFGLIGTSGATADISLGSTGEDTTNKNMPPYHAIVYKIKIA